MPKKVNDENPINVTVNKPTPETSDHVFIGNYDVGYTEEELKNMSDKKFEKVASKIAKNILSDDSNNFVKEFNALRDAAKTAATTTKYPETKEAIVMIDQESGTRNVIPSDLPITPQDEYSRKLDEETAKLLDMDVDELLNPPESISDIKISPELIHSAVTTFATRNDKTIAETDIEMIVSAVSLYHNSTITDRKDINWYLKMPTLLKSMIDKQTATSGLKGMKTFKNRLAAGFIEQIIEDAQFNKISIDYTATISKVCNVSNILSMGFNDIHNSFENKMLDIISDAKEKGDTVKVEKIEKVMARYHEAWNFTDFIDKVNHKKIKINPSIDIKKYGKYVWEFNHKYEGDTPFQIKDISIVAPILLRNLRPFFNETHIVLFMIALIKYTANMNASDMYDHIYMDNIVNLPACLDLVGKDVDERNFENVYKYNLIRAVRAVSIKCGFKFEWEEEEIYDKLNKLSK